MTKPINNDADAVFTKNWNVYNKMIAHNYMFHREFIDEINRVIDTMPDSQPLTVLDLGCGDAALFSKVLERRPIALYVGYDTSAEVLRYAAASLQGLKADTRLVNDYLQNATTIEQEPFDLVYSSFAIHHLQDEQKTRFFREAYDRLLTPGGVFIYVDVLRADDQARSEYLDAYISNMAAKWIALDEHEFKLIEDHIRAYDFPMEKGKLMTLLQETGFSVNEPALFDGMHSILVLRK